VGASTVSDASAAARETLDPHRVWRLVLVLTLLPLVISAVTMAITVGNSYHPWADYAVMELKVRDVGHHPLLIGLYSRDGWSHPGPILFYLLALPYRLSGESAIGLQLGALLINGSAMVGMALVARRRGGTPLLLCTLLGCGLLVRTLGPDFVRDPWVCYITVIPFGLMVLLSWSMACGDTWALPVGAGVASFLAQTHIGYVALALPLLAWGALALVWLAARRNRDKRGGGARAGPDVGAVARAGAIAAVVAAVMWLPTFIDQLLPGPGNLGEIVQWIQAGKTHTLAQGYRVVGAQFGWPPEWLTHLRPVTFVGETAFLHAAPRPVLLVPVGVAGFVLWHVRANHAGRLVATVGLGLILGVVAVASTTGIVYDYRLRWTWILGMMAFVVVAWTAWLVITARSRRGDRWLVPAALCTLGLLSIVNSVSAARARISPSLKPSSSVLAALEPQVVRALPDRAGDVIIRATSPGAGFYQSGLLLRLERQGITARADSNPGDTYGRHRLRRKGPVRAVFTVAADEGFDTLSAHPGSLRLLAYEGDRSRTDRARVHSRRVVELAQLDAERQAGRIDVAEYVRRVSRLPDPGPAVAVFESPPDRRLAPHPPGG
jgi:hypothetical protein